MLSSKENSHYFLGKYRHLRDKYGFASMEINPCVIRTKDDLVQFTERILCHLLKEEEVRFVERNEADPTDKSRVQFYVNDQLRSLSLDEKHGHLEFDFFTTLEEIAMLLGKRIKRINDDPIYVAGDAKAMKEAWTEGFPILIDEVDFLHKHVNGKRFKKSEKQSQFILNEKIKPDSYKELLKTGLNRFLEKKNKEIRFNDKQITAYEVNRGLIYLSLNNYYCGNFQLHDASTTFHNCILNQIFLIHYCQNNPAAQLTYRLKNGEEQSVDTDLEAFVNGFGQETSH